MASDLETGHGGGGARPTGGSDVGRGGDGPRALDVNSSVRGRGRTARRISRRREQEWMIILAIHAVYLAANGLLFLVIQIKYQNLKSPFETHMAMTSSVVALCVYFYAGALQTLLLYTGNKLEDLGLLNPVLLCSGILSPLSNVLVFFPNTVGWVVIVPFVFAIIILQAYKVFKLISNRISKRNNSNNNDATPTPESVAMEITGNNNDAVEMPTGNNSTHTRFHSFGNQGFGA